LRSTQVVVDILTDVRCPFSFISQLNLDQALKNMKLNSRAVVRYHPVFLNPNVPQEGESLDDYLLREYGYSKEYAHSETYPLRLAGLEAGVELNPHRRVVNTFDAFCLIRLAQEQGRQHDVVKLLSKYLFEDAKDISDELVLTQAAEEAGLCEQGYGREFFRLHKPRLKTLVQDEYEALNQQVQEVPHFLLRERMSGNGLEIGGNRSVEEWENVLTGVLEKSRLIGMSVPGPHGSDLWLVEANPNKPVSMALRAQHGWNSAEWPYSEQDFSRMDESTDDYMYAEPRFVNHLDDSSLARLAEVYRSVFEAAPEGFSVLDLCSSWVSHYPQESVSRASRVTVHGLNELELKANTQATDRHVQDLNLNATLPWASDSYDVVTMALSVQYLTDPRAVFSEIHRVLRPGGMAVIAYSHRTFIEKAVNVWAKETYDGEGHAHLIANYFRHGPAAGWSNLSSIDVSPNHGDPMWMVTAIKA